MNLFDNYLITGRRRRPQQRLTGADPIPESTGTPCLSALINVTTLAFDGFIRFLSFFPSCHLTGVAHRIRSLERPNQIAVSAAE